MKPILLIVCFVFLFFSCDILFQENNVTADNPKEPVYVEERIGAYSGLSYTEISDNSYVIEFSSNKTVEDALGIISQESDIKPSHILYEVNDNGKFLFSGGSYLPNSGNISITNCINLIMDSVESFTSMIEKEKNKFLAEGNSKNNYLSEDLEYYNNLIAKAIFDNIIITGFQAIIQDPTVVERLNNSDDLNLSLYKNMIPDTSDEDSSCSSCSITQPKGDPSLCPKFHPSEGSLDLYTNQYGFRTIEWTGKWTDTTTYNNMALYNDPAFEPDIKLWYNWAGRYVGWAQIYPHTNWIQRNATFQKAYIDIQAVDNYERAYTIGTVDPVNDISFNTTEFTQLVVGPNSNDPSFHYGYFEVQLDKNDQCTESAPNWSWGWCVTTDGECKYRITPPLGLIAERYTNLTPYLNQQ